LSSINVDTSSVRFALERMNCSAAGPDGLPGMFYKKLGYWLTEPLTVIFQQSIYQCTIPDDWRVAKVIPLYKGKGERTCPSSYRPISLTAVACKILERLVVDQMSDYLSSYSLLYREQHGFMQHKSTITNLLRCDTIISNHLNNRDSCDIIAIDFSRAFDKVSHDILGRKLEGVGICGKLHKWLMDFLSTRSQYVWFNGAQSDIIPVTSGVIQGSVCGPKLFSIFINDMHECVTSSDLLLFADDGKVVGKASTTTDCELIQADLDAVGEWSAVNELPLCLPKCQCLHLGSSNGMHTYHIDATAISSVDQLTDLGVLRSANASYSSHIDSIVSKGSRAAGMLYRAFSTRRAQFLVKIFKAYVRPIVEYASVVWNPTAVACTGSLEKVQRRFTKRLPGMRTLGYDERLEALHLESLEERRLRAELLMVFSILHNRVALDSDSIGITLSDTSTRSQGANLVVRRAVNGSVSKFFPFRVSKTWNSLPASLKHATSYTAFKTQLFKCSLTSLCRQQ
jgi:Reverse transcriptase (RNA-dependent DNA polymerase)